MEIQNINVQFERLIYAYHGGYTFVAKSSNVPLALIEALKSSKYPFYYHNRAFDEEIRPQKYRYFQVHVENDAYYIFCRLESKHDTMRGMVSEAQFYILQGDQGKIFENELHANAPHLIMQIRFKKTDPILGDLQSLNMDYSQLAKNNLLEISALTQTVSVEDVDLRIRNLIDDIKWDSFSGLFTEHVLDALDRGQRVLIHGKRYQDPVSLLGILCRGFITAQLDCYRRNLSFTTSEFSQNIGDYQITFLHGAAIVDGQQLQDDVQYISLDSIQAGQKMLWYLTPANAAEPIQSYHRFLSKRLALRNFPSIETLQAYCEMLVHENQKIDIQHVCRIARNIQDIVPNLDSSAMSNDFLSIIDKLPLQELKGKLNPLIDFYSTWYLISSQAQNKEQWGNDLCDGFIRHVISWFELLIHSGILSANDSSVLIKAAESFRQCDSILKDMIIRKMLSDGSGMGKPLDWKELKQPAGYLAAWLHLVDNFEECTVRDDDSIIHQVWQLVQSVIENCEDQYRDSDDFNDVCQQVCRRLCRLYQNADEVVKLYFQIFQVLIKERLFSVFFSLVSEFVKEYGKNEEMSSRIRSFFVQSFFPLVEDQIIDRFTDYVLLPLLRYENRFLSQITYDISKMSMTRDTLIPTVLKKFVYVGNNSNITVRQCESIFLQARDGILRNTPSSNVKNEIVIQEELLENLGILPILNRRLNVDGYVFTICTPEFDRRFSYLSRESKRMFFRNLAGFSIDRIDRFELTGVMLPVFWSYLQSSHEDLVDIDSCFGSMMEYMQKRLGSSSLSNKSHNQIMNLCAEIETIPCEYIRGEKIPLKTSGGRKYIKFDHENCLFQIAATTQNNRNRIDQFITYFIRNQESYDWQQYMVKYLKKYYIPSVSSSITQEYWKEQLTIWEIHSKRRILP